MNRTLFLLTSFIFAIGCNEARFQKILKSPLEYKIISGGGDKPIRYGNTIKFAAIGYYRDSMLTTPYDTIAKYVAIDSLRMPSDFLSIFLKAKKGDSIITRILADSLQKIGTAPPYARPGNYLGFRIKIIDIITDSALAETLKLEAQKQIIAADSIGRERQKVHPFTFIIGQGGVIEGWDDGLRLFKKGGKGKLYIPSNLGYGQRGNGPDILPNICLVFDISIADLTTGEAYLKKIAEQEKADQQK